MFQFFKSILENQDNQPVLELALVSILSFKKQYAFHLK